MRLKFQIPRELPVLIKQTPAALEAFVIACIQYSRKGATLKQDDNDAAGVLCEQRQRVRVVVGWLALWQAENVEFTIVEC